MAEKLTNSTIEIFCRSISLMLKAGVATAEAVNILSMDKTEFRVIVKDMDEGDSLSAAMEKSALFPEYAVGMIKTGERSGRLEEVLYSLAGYYERQESFANRLKNAVLYPIVLLVLMSLVLLIMVWKVLPLFIGVYESMSGSLAGSSYSYVSFAEILGWSCLVIILALCFAILLSFVLYKGKRTRPSFVKFIERFPLTKLTSEKIATAGFISSLSLLIASGFDEVSAVEEAEKTVSHTLLIEKLDAIHKDLESGKSLSQSIYDSSIVEPLYGRLLISGSMSGSLESALSELAEKTEADAENRVRRVIDVVEPVLTCFLTVSVGVSLLSVMLPLIGILNSMG